MKLTNILISIFMFIFADGFFSSSLEDDIDTSDVQALIKQINKFNRTITKQKDVINKMKEYNDKLNEENQKLKNVFKNQTEAIDSVKIVKPHQEREETSTTNPGVRITSEIRKSIDKIMEHQSFYQQIELQIAREKELRDSVDSKLREINQAQYKIEKMYNEINTGVKTKVDDLEKKYENLDKNNYNLNQRVFILEKEKEKEQLVRNMNKNGIKTESIIEPSCVNRNSCSVCLEDTKCVWCNIERRCKLGDLSGPYDGSCLNSFEYSTCSQNSCLKYSTCSECIQNAACGWCAQDNKCIDGTEKGAIGLICSNYIHFNGYARCPIKKSKFFK